MQARFRNRDRKIRSLEETPAEYEWARSPARRPVSRRSAPPAFGDRHRLEDRKVSRQIRLGFRQDRLDRLGIENPNRLKRRGTIKGPGSRNIPFLDETATDPQAKLAPLLRERGKEIEEEPKGVRYDRGDVRAALGHRIAAVKTLAKSKIRRADRVVRCPVERRRPHEQSPGS